jgi:hypothetical protein
MLRFAQHDIDEVARVAAQSPTGEGQDEGIRLMGIAGLNPSYKTMKE